MPATARAFAHCFFASVCAVAGLAAVSGCDDAAPRKSKIVSTSVTTAADADKKPLDPAEIKAREILDQMAETYRSATTYADSGTVRLKYKQGERPVDESVDFAVTLERPNKVRLNLYQALVVSDGEKFSAAISDLEGEVLQVAAPEKLTLEEIYKHELLNGALTNNLAGASPQLAFLLNDKAVELLAGQGTAPPRLVTPGEIEGDACDRVSIERADGKLLLWIDQKSHVLRRVEYPVQELSQNMNAAGPVSGVSLVADFTGARVNQPIDPMAFQFEAPASAKIVESFVRRVEVPRPEPPSSLLGQQAPAFTFYTLDGRPVTKDSLAGKITVIDFWFTTCAPCQATMPLVQQVFAEYAKDDRVQFYAVSISDPEGGNLELQKALQDWGVKLPMLRDADRFYESAFKIPGAPALFVIGPDGRVQDNHVGINTTLAEDLTQTIQQLLAGKDTFELAKERYDRKLAEYQQAQTDAAGSGSIVQEAPDGEIAPPSEPKTFKLSKLWSASAVKEPGNIFITRDGEAAPKTLVLEGFHQVVELDAKGGVADRHVLDIPEGAVIRYIRTATDKDGHRSFAGSASAQQQVHVFDGDWKLKQSYPSLEGGKSEGITDVQLADLNGDGQPELNVAFWGAGGIHNVALDGARNWHNQALELVYRLAVTGADADGKRSMLATNRQGTLVSLAPDGVESEHHSVGTRYLHSVFAADLNGDGQTEICAIARDQANRESIVGVGPEFTFLWEHPLPFGWHRHAIEPVVTGKITTDGEALWIVPGADGSIQFIDREGKLIDRFQHGAALSGLAATEIDGKPALVIATATGVEAWAVEKR